MNILVYLAAAQVDPDSVNIPKVGASQVVGDVLNLVYFVGGIVAVIMIIVSGLLYVISEGDPSKTKRAKDGILYSVVGLVIILSAFVITRFVVGEF